MNLEAKSTNPLSPQLQKSFAAAAGLLVALPMTMPAVATAEATATVKAAGRSPPGDRPSSPESLSERKELGVPPCRVTRN